MYILRLKIHMQANCDSMSNKSLQYSPMQIINDESLYTILSKRRGFHQFLIVARENFKNKNKNKINEE